MSKIRIALAGGGTGGHVYPIMAVISALRGMNVGDRELSLHYFGSKNEFSEPILGSGAIYHHVLATKLRRYFSLQNFIDIPLTFIAFLEALWKLYWVMPDVLFSKGGPGALPVVLAAWFYRIPVIIHESDATPGLTNMISSWFSKRVALTFEAAAKFFEPKKIIITGAPVREELLRSRLEKGAAKERLGFDAGHPLLLILGGSQGARSLNEFTISNLSTLLPMTQIYHQTGRNNFEDVQALAATALRDLPLETEKNSRYKNVAFLNEELMAEALSAADVVLMRAGSGSIGEAAAFGIPMLLVPLSSEVVGPHQRENAYAVQSVGAALVLEEENLAPTIVQGALQKILSDEGSRQKMSVAASALHKSDAAKRIAEAIIALTQ